MLGRTGRVVPLIVVVLLVVSAASMAQVDIGLLPFRAQLPDAFYAHVVVEVATDDPEKAGLTLESEQRVYYKKPDSPHVFPYYYPDVGPQAWPAETSELPTVYETPPIPELPIDLFYANYEIRVHGLDEAAGRSCFLVSIMSRASGHPVADYCVDRETGLALRSVTYDLHGNATYRRTYLEFDPDPDLEGIDFPRLPFRVMQYPSTDLTADELTARLPWIRLPTWLPGNFQLLAIQHWHRQAPDGRIFRWWGQESERYEILYTDGLDVLTITVLAPLDQTKLPERTDFSAPAGPLDDNALRSLSATGPYVLATRKMDRIPDGDLYRILWSMLPGGPEDDDIGPDVNPEPMYQGGHYDAL